MNYKFSDNISALKPSAIREILKNSSGANIIPFSAGNPAPEAFPCEALRQISDSLFMENPVSALQYSITEGYTPLRDFVGELMVKNSCKGNEDEILITSGAQQAIDLTCKVFCNSGDTLICEAPSFIGSLNAFRANGAKLIGIPMESDGINIDMLESALIKNPRTKLMYLIPNFQNPSGITMSLEKRKAVYSLAHKYDVIIIEDNPYGDLRFSGTDLPSVKSFDKDGRVVYCGTFSKVLAPGLRVGYACGNKDIISKLTVAKQTVDVHTNIWAQIITQRFFMEFDYSEHTRKLSEIYKRKCELMLSNLNFSMPESISFTSPEGGLFIWATLPDSADMPEFCKTAAASSVTVVPGSAFMVDEKAPSQSFRLNYSTPTDEQIVKGVEILSRLAKERGI